MEIKKLSFIYLNYKGERSERLVKPIEIYYGSTEYHPEPQLLLKAFDIEKKAERDFAMDSIFSWGKIC